MKDRNKSAQPGIFSIFPVFCMAACGSPDGFGTLAEEPEKIGFQTGATWITSCLVAEYSAFWKCLN